MTIDVETVEERIRDCQVELATLQLSHDQMIATHNAAVKVFEEQVRMNQNRFQQLTGVIAELEKLVNLNNSNRQEKTYGN